MSDGLAFIAGAAIASWLAGGLVTIVAFVLIVKAFKKAWRAGIIQSFFEDL